MLLDSFHSPNFTPQKSRTALGIPDALQRVKNVDTITHRQLKNEEASDPQFHHPSYAHSTKGHIQCTKLALLRGLGEVIGRQPYPWFGEADSCLAHILPTKNMILLSFFFLTKNIILRLHFCKLSAVHKKEETLEGNLHAKYYSMRNDSSTNCIVGDRNSYHQIYHSCSISTLVSSPTPYKLAA